MRLLPFFGRKEGEGGGGGDSRQWVFAVWGVPFSFVVTLWCRICSIHPNPKHYYLFTRVVSLFFSLTFQAVTTGLAALLWEKEGWQVVDVWGVLFTKVVSHCSPSHSRQRLLDCCPPLGKGRLASSRCVRSAVRLHGEFLLGVHLHTQHSTACSSVWWVPP